MKIQIKGLNSNEIYCCTQEDVKLTFGDTDIDVIFGGFNISRREKVNSEKFRPYKKCSDIIVAKMVIHKNEIKHHGLSLGSYLIFFIMDKKDFLNEYCQIFKKEVLPKLRLVYNDFNKMIDFNKKTYSVTVGLKGGCFNLYELKTC